MLLTYKATSAKILTILLTLLFSTHAFTANGNNNDGRSDYDLDNDGLIEINDLSDLDEIRNNLNGKALYKGNLGCPTLAVDNIDGCNGFELTTDLNFDTNNDGIMDSKDEYWDEGYGWFPIGSRKAPFSAILQGNGYLIKNLYINQPYDSKVGLFSVTNNAVIKQLGLVGHLGSITGSTSVGSFIGLAFNTHLDASFNSIEMSATDPRSSIGGLIGFTQAVVSISNSINSGTVKGATVGGLVGNADRSKLSIINSINTGPVRGLTEGQGRLAGLLGNGARSPKVTHSYWAKDLSQQMHSTGAAERTGYIGLDSSILRCAINANTSSENSACISSDGAIEGLSSGLILYKGWDKTIWDFGTSEQLPGLRFTTRILRDSDADGAVDEMDAWPSNPAAALDSDQDGYPDYWSTNCDVACINDSNLVLDKFPHNPLIWLDDDNDGLADICNTQCIESGLIVDSHLDDTDNDGKINSLDDDDNNDGKKDIDRDNNGLVDIDSLAKLNAIRFQLQGHGLKLTEEADMSTQGCPFVIIKRKSQPLCHGYELTKDLDFDSNGDGKLDAQDTYWNVDSKGNGQGWLPIGEKYAPFSALFQGNGHVIKNLYINRPNGYSVGLFGETANASIQKIGLVGKLGAITGKYKVGSLIGQATNTQLNASFNSLDIKATDSFSGGLIGQVISGVTISNSLNSGSVQSSTSGGLVSSCGYSRKEHSDISIVNSMNIGIVKASIEGKGQQAGLLGYGCISKVTHSYWAKDLSQQVSSNEITENTGYMGVDSSMLRCVPQKNTTCISNNGKKEGVNSQLALYTGWDNAIWDFGTPKQLPGLLFGNRVLRGPDE